MQQQSSSWWKGLKIRKWTKTRVLLLWLLWASGWLLSAFFPFLSEDYFGDVGLVFPSAAGSFPFSGRASAFLPQTLPEACQGQAQGGHLLSFPLHFFLPVCTASAIMCSQHPAWWLILRHLVKLRTPRKLILNSSGEVSLPLTISTWNKKNVINSSCLLHLHKAPDYGLPFYYSLL